MTTRGRPETPGKPDDVGKPEKPKPQKAQGPGTPLATPLTAQASWLTHSGAGGHIQGGLPEQAIAHKPPAPPGKPGQPLPEPMVRMTPDTTITVKGDSIRVLTDTPNVRVVQET